MANQPFYLDAFDKWYTAEKHAELFGLTTYGKCRQAYEFGCAETLKSSTINSATAEALRNALTENAQLLQLKTLMEEKIKSQFNLIKALEATVIEQEKKIYDQPKI